MTDKLLWTDSTWIASEQLRSLKGKPHFLPTASYSIVCHRVNSNQKYRPSENRAGRVEGEGLIYLILNFIHAIVKVRSDPLPRVVVAALGLLSDLASRHHPKAFHKTSNDLNSIGLAVYSVQLLRRL